MSIDPEMENQEFLKYWFTHTDANSVFKWLKRQKPDYSDSDEEIITVLINRNEPLVNLGLALYATLPDKQSLCLFRDGDRTIKKALLTGTFSIRLLYSWVDEVLTEILDSFDEELLQYLLKNQTIDDTFLTSLYEKDRWFKDLTDEQWLKTIAFTISNPRISTSLDKLPWDFYEFGSYQQVFSTGWKLFETLPVNKDSAAVLSHLGENLVPNKPHDMDVFATIKRWEGENDESSDVYLNVYLKCRYVLAKLIGGTEFESLKDNDDLALRLSYYNRFRAHKPEEVRELFEKDNDKFLNVAIYNTKLYMNENIREELRQCCRDYEDPYALMIYPESFNAQVERLTKDHPEWFPDFDGTIPFDAIEDPLQRANKRLEFLQQQTRTLIGSEDQPSMIDDLHSAINDVKSDLKNSNEQIERLQWESEDNHSLIEKINISTENINTILSESNRQLSEQLSKIVHWGWVMGGVIIFLLLIVKRTIE
ncbi:hypothetical protein JT359_14695 [Candidatus Poribacteria bacterium]|nr:hypothetical protein [Candidatus Poribacteria bacterium]